jgi:hypothetical protein
VPSSLAVALLVAGAAFPLSRIMRVDLAAHAVDALLLAGSTWLAARWCRTVLLWVSGLDQGRPARSRVQAAKARRAASSAGSARNCGSLTSTE